MLRKRLLLLLVALTMTVVAALVPACSPRQAESDSQVGDTSDQTDSLVNDESELTIPKWTPQTDCASCHIVETESGEDPSHLYGLHQTKDVELTCIDCHDQSVELETAHEDKTAESRAPTRLRKTDIEATRCLECHDLGDLSTLTTTSTVLTDKNGTTVNPHTFTPSESHDSVLCADCHKMHKPVIDVSENAQATCKSCHHENVYECGTCH